MDKSSMTRSVVLFMDNNTDSKFLRLIDLFGDINRDPDMKLKVGIVFCNES
jgi:hypothetical protein